MNRVISRLRKTIRNVPEATRDEVLAILVRTQTSKGEDCIALLGDLTEYLTEEDRNEIVAMTRRAVVNATTVPE